MILYAIVRLEQILKTFNRKSSTADATNQFGGLKIKEEESVFVFDQNKKSKYHINSIGKVLNVSQLGTSFINSIEEEIAMKVTTYCKQKTVQITFKICKIHKTGNF